MSDAFWVAMFACLTSATAAIVTLVITLKTHKQVVKVEKATNSLTDRLVATTRIEAHAAGVLEEKERHTPG